MDDSSSGTYTSPVQSDQPKGLLTPINLNRVLVILGFLGIFDASLLSAEKLFGLNLMCGAEGGCNTVANHHTAYVFGIPVAYIGFAAYVVLTILASLRAILGVQRGPLLTIGYAMAGFGAAASIYYQFTMFVVIQAFCPYCFGSAINMILQLITYALLASKLPKEWVPPVVGLPVDKAIVSLGALSTVAAVLIGGSILQSKVQPPTFVPPDAKVSDLLPKKSHEHSFGDPNSPILVIEFADLACIHCQELTPKLHQFVDQHPGKIYTIYRHFPLVKPHPMAVTASLVAEYAGEKGKFWDYVQGIMSPMDEPKTPEAVFAPAEAIGLNVDDIKKHITDPQDPTLDAVNEDMSVANEFGITGTPTFFIEMKGEKIKVCTASNIFDALSSPPYKQVLTRK